MRNGILRNLHEKQQTFVDLSKNLYDENRMQQADLPQRVSVATKLSQSNVPCLDESALRNAVREATTLNTTSHQNVIAVIGADQFLDIEGFKHMLLLT